MGDCPSNIVSARALCPMHSQRANDLYTFCQNGGFEPGSLGWADTARNARNSSSFDAAPRSGINHGVLNRGKHWRGWLRSEWSSGYSSWAEDLETTRAELHHKFANDM